MKLFVVIGGNSIFINNLLNVWKKKYQVNIFNKHRDTENERLLQRKFRAARNILSLKSREILSNYEWSDITFVEWASYALRIISKRVDGSTPIITRLHRFEVFSPKLNKIDFSVVSKIVLISGAIKRKLVKRIPELEEKVIVIPHGIRTENLPLLSEKRRTKKVCIISALTQRKRIDLIMRAIKWVEDVSLHIAGSGKNHESLRKLATDLEIEHRTSFYGQIPHQNILNWLVDKDIIINASESEGSPFSLLEAMSLGVIPFVRYWDGAKEIHPDYVIPFDESHFVDELSNRIKSFYALSESEVENMRNQTRTIFHEIFSFKKQVERHDQLFSQILSDQMFKR